MLQSLIGKDVEGMKKGKVVVIVGGLFAMGLLGGVLFAQSSTPGQREWGPYACSQCSLPTPYVDTDPMTLNTLSSTWMALISNRWDPRPGETITLCNGSGCVTYRRLQDGFFGGEPKPQQTLPPPGERGGGGSEGDGGGGGGGGTNPPNPGGRGGGSGGGGTVRVGPIRPV